MKKARNIKIGDVVQFPAYEFQRCRSGWNGWIFRAAIVERLYISKSGYKCAEITYCTATAGRYQLLPNMEATKKIRCDYLFEYNLELHRKYYLELAECEKNGEPVCWSPDTALLVNHGIY